LIISYLFIFEKGASFEVEKFPEKKSQVGRPPRAGIPNASS
jgi:hypothetical protein